MNLNVKLSILFDEAIYTTWHQAIISIGQASDLDPAPKPGINFFESPLKKSLLISYSENSRRVERVNLARNQGFKLVNQTFSTAPGLGMALFQQALTDFFNTPHEGL